MNSVGIELGGTRVTAVRVDADGAVQARTSEPVRAGDEGTAAQAVYQSVRGSESVAALGVATAFQSEVMPPDVLRQLSDAQGSAPVALTTGQAAVLAEAWTGAARGFTHVVWFAIGEHVTSGVLLDGRLLKGASGHAGSVAWLALNPVEREDYRRHGGLEAEVAAAGIVRRLVWRIKSGDHSAVVDRVNGELARLTVDDVMAAARQGDGVAISVVRDTAKIVGMAIANLATILDPECIVLGGALAASGDLMLDSIRTEYARRLRPAQAAAVQIVQSALGDDAAAIGAARAALLQRG